MRAHAAIGLLCLGLALAAPPPALGNAAPQPPITRDEVTDPQSWLRMESEVVDITVQGERAHVSVKFHFTPAKRNDFTVLVMRMGFPELAADAPLERFTVRQAPTMEPAQELPASSPPVTITQRPAADAWSKALGVRRWFTWQVELPAARRYSHPTALDVEVGYDQALKRKGRAWQTTYVLRTGAPWAGNVAKSTVNVRLEPGMVLVSSSPKGYKTDGGGLTYTFENWEPNTDVTFTVRRK